MDPYLKSYIILFNIETQVIDLKILVFEYYNMFVENRVNTSINTAYYIIKHINKAF